MATDIVVDANTGYQPVTIDVVTVVLDVATVTMHWPKDYQWLKVGKHVADAGDDADVEDIEAVAELFFTPEVFAGFRAAPDIRMRS